MNTYCSVSISKQCCRATSPPAIALLTLYSAHTASLGWMSVHTCLCIGRHCWCYLLPVGWTVWSSG